MQEEALQSFFINDKLKETTVAVDNFFKMALIFLRIKSKIPIIIMGETGIGKTALVTLLS